MPVPGRLGVRLDVNPPQRPPAHRGQRFRASPPSWRSSRPGRSRCVATRTWTHTVRRSSMQWAPPRRRARLTGPGAALVRATPRITATRAGPAAVTGRDRRPIPQRGRTRWRTPARRCGAARPDTSPAGTRLAGTAIPSATHAIPLVRRHAPRRCVPSDLVGPDAVQSAGSAHPAQTARPPLVQRSRQRSRSGATTGNRGTGRAAARRWRTRPCRPAPPRRRIGAGRTPRRPEPRGNRARRGRRRPRRGQALGLLRHHRLTHDHQPHVVAGQRPERGDQIGQALIRPHLAERQEHDGRLSGNPNPARSSARVARAGANSPT